MTASVRRAKIVATVGPASRTVQQLTDLIAAGVDTIRVNTSHLTPEQALELYQDLDTVRDITGCDFATLTDLQGPKLRLGRDFTPRPVSVSDQITLTAGTTATDQDPRIPVAIDDFAQHVRVGDRITLGDSTPVLQVAAINGGNVICTTIRAGQLRPRMGVTIPTAFHNVPALTEQDLDHLAVAADHADWVALSFVRNAEDVRLLRWALKIRGARARVIAKIERAGALDHLDEIVREADGIMVARGDLALEIGMAGVPFAQARIIDCAQQHAKTVITATQVLESMITADAPTRAEAGDIARALIEGTSALMLSAETATGANPTLTVQTMRELIVAAEQHLVWQPREIPDRDPERASLVHAADRLATDQSVSTILIPTDTGTTARMAASLARQTLIALCPDPHVRRQLALERGVITVPWDGDHGQYLPVSVLAHVTDIGLTAPGERVVVVWSHTHQDPHNPIQLVAALQLDTSTAGKPAAETFPAVS